MKISLGGSAGQSTSGMTNAGSRTVEQVTPPPKRPEPVRPVPPRPPDPAPVATPRPTARPAPSRPIELPPQTTASSPTRPPATGAQLNTGNTNVETGARGQGAGLSFKQGVGGGETDLSNFCCPEYLARMLSDIDARWTKRPPGEERGTTTVKFTINRDGSIDNILTEVSSGSGQLDRNSRAALIGLRLPALPPEYANATLTVHLEFPYNQ